MIGRIIEAYVESGGRLLDVKERVTNFQAHAMSAQATDPTPVVPRRVCVAGS